MFNVINHWVSSYSFSHFQAIDRGRNKVELVKYNPEKDKTGIDDWLEQNQGVAKNIQEEEAREKQSQDFWDFNQRQGGGTGRGRNRR